MGPGSSRTNELLPRERLTGEQESQGQIPSHGDSYCQSRFQEA